MSLIGDDRMQSREAAVHSSNALEAVTTRLRLREAARTGSSPTVAGNSGAFDSAGAYTPYHRAGDAIDSVDAILAP